jgi:kynureninase
MRFGMAPLYVRHVDVWDAVTVLGDVMRSGAWREPGFAERRTVT